MTSRFWHIITPAERESRYDGTELRTNRFAQLQSLYTHHVQPPPAAKQAQGDDLSLTEISSRLVERRDADWKRKKEALAALGRFVAKHGIEKFDAAAQKQVSAGLLEQLKTERSQLVSDACALLVRLAGEHGRAVSPLVERLLPDMIEVTGAGNKTIGKTFLKPAVLSLAGSVPLGPKALVDVHRVMAGGSAAAKNPTTCEAAARYVNVALAQQQGRQTPRTPTQPAAT